MSNKKQILFMELPMALKLYSQYTLKAETTIHRAVSVAFFSALLTSKW